MKTNYKGLWVFALLVLGWAVEIHQAGGSPAKLQRNYYPCPETYVATNRWLVQQYLEDGETPARMAYKVSATEPMDGYDRLPEGELAKLDWQPFKTNLLIDLGPGSGRREIYFAVQWKNPDEYGQFTRVMLILTNPPHAVITNPTNHTTVTSQPYLQLQGYCTGETMYQGYDIANCNGKLMNQDALPTDHTGEYDTKVVYFQAYDVALAMGTNDITFHANVAGNLVSTNIVVIYSTNNDTIPPVITPLWPTNEMDICGATFTARGNVDDYTASMKGIISGGGQTKVINGLVERNGTYWVENIPMLAKTNILTLIATDAAGNSSQTNLLLIKSDIDIFFESIPSGHDLWKPFGKVTGRVTPGYDVYVNGTKAVVAPDGHWHCDHTPISGGGTATFDANAVPSEAMWAANNKALGIKNLLTSSTDIKDEPIVVNPGQPVCGNFALHLTGTYKKKFVLTASTNLQDWIPILTNLNSAPTFDYTDTNAAGYSCRFFKVIPVP